MGLARDPSLTVVREALHQRLVDPSASIDEAGIARLLALVRRETAAIRGGCGVGP